MTSGKVAFTKLTRSGSPLASPWSSVLRFPTDVIGVNIANPLPVFAEDYFELVKNLRFHEKDFDELNKSSKQSWFESKIKDLQHFHQQRQLKFASNHLNPKPFLLELHWQYIHQLCFPSNKSQLN